jgi:hypothetical protein
MSKARSGGGITSNKLVRPDVRSGAPSTNKMSPAGAAQLGVALGDKVHNRAHTGQGFRTPLQAGVRAQVPLGNAVAGNVGGGGPGTGRTVYGAGSQGQHGPVARDPVPAPRGLDARGRNGR